MFQVEKIEFIVIFRAFFRVFSFVPNNILEICHLTYRGSSSDNGTLVKFYLADPEAVLRRSRNLKQTKNKKSATLKIRLVQF